MIYKIQSDNNYLKLSCVIFNSKSPVPYLSSNNILFHAITLKYMKKKMRGQKLIKDLYCSNRPLCAVQPIYIEEENTQGNYIKLSRVLQLVKHVFFHMSTAIRHSIIRKIPEVHTFQPMSSTNLNEFSYPLHSWKNNEFSF